MCHPKGLLVKKTPGAVHLLHHDHNRHGLCRIKSWLYNEAKYIKAEGDPTHWLLALDLSH